MADTHRKIVMSRRGGPEVLEVTTEAVPRPGPGSIRVRVLAAGVSAYDVMLRSKWFPGFPRPPWTPGVDLVGIVDELGDEVAEPAIGRIVAASTGAGCGGYAEMICLPARELVPVPPGVDPADAVCLVANYLTAHLAMHTVAKVRSSDRALIHGAAGGVGTALVELGRLAGLEMYGTASAHNHELVHSLGAVPIDYRTEDFVAAIRRLTGDGVDAVFDPVGGARQLVRSYQTLRKGGRLVWFGVAGTLRDGIGVIPASLIVRLGLALLPDGKRAPLMPNLGKSSDEHNRWYCATLTDLLDHLAAGKLTPVVAARFPLTDAARAHAYLETGGHAGKVVLLTGAADG